MPIKDIPSRFDMDPATAAEADRIASVATEFLRDELDKLERDGRLAVTTVGTECLAAQLNLLAERLGERRHYNAPMTSEMKHAEMLSLIIGNAVDRAMTRTREGRR